MIRIHKLLVAAVIFFTAASIYSCKKNIDPPAPPVNGNLYDDYTFTNSLYDSLYMYAHALYYWNNKLSNFKTFNPNQYKNADEQLGLKNELYAFTSPFEFGTPSKYSYLLKTIDDRNGGNSSIHIIPNKEALTIDGKGNDLGIDFGFIEVKRDTVVTYIQSVTVGSPAHEKGLKRGNIVYKINNDTISFNRFTSNYERNKFYNDIIKGSSVNLITVDSLWPVSGFRKETAFSVEKKQYEFNPVFKDTVIQLSNGIKVGYIAYQAFTDLEHTKKYISPVFSRFNSENITELIVDLRYNGGGRVNTAYHFANLIVPPGNDGKVLSKSFYNDSLRRNTVEEQKTYSDYLKSVLRSQKTYEADGVTPSGGTALDYNYSITGNTDYIKKVGALNSLKKVYFIVSGQTASASELLINSLKPYLTVKLVGARYAEDLYNNQLKTYGKPIGFFPVYVGQYTVYMSMFESKNARDEGGYFDGFLTNTLGSDDFTKGFVNSKEQYDPLNIILKELNPDFKISNVSASAYEPVRTRSNAVQQQIQSYQHYKAKDEFKGMVAVPRSL